MSAVDRRLGRAREAPVPSPLTVTHSRSPTPPCPCWRAPPSVLRTTRVAAWRPRRPCPPPRWPRAATATATPSTAPPGLPWRSGRRAPAPHRRGSRPGRRPRTATRTGDRGVPGRRSCCGGCWRCRVWPSRGGRSCRRREWAGGCWGWRGPRRGAARAPGWRARWRMRWGGGRRRRTAKRGGWRRATGHGRACGGEEHEGRVSRLPLEYFTQAVATIVWVRSACAPHRHCHLPG